MSRRCVFVRVPMQSIIGVLCGRFSQPTVQLPRFEDLPGNVEVQSVTVDWESNSALVALSHPTFDEVPDGATLPEVTSRLGLVEVSLVPVPTESHRMLQHVASEAVNWFLRMKQPVVQRCITDGTVYEVEVRETPRIISLPDDWLHFPDDTEEDASPGGFSREADESGPKGAVYGLELSFHIDTDAYTDRDRAMFVAGYEFSTIVHRMRENAGFCLTIHRENESRVRMAAAKLGRRVAIETCSDDSDPAGEWSFLEVFER